MTIHLKFAGSRPAPVIQWDPPSSWTEVVGLFAYLHFNSNATVHLVNGAQIASTMVSAKQLCITYTLGTDVDCVATFKASET